MTVRCEDVDLDLKVSEFRINGFTVIEDALSAATVDRVREAFLPMLEHVRTREDGIAPKEWGELRTGYGRQQMVNRYTLTIPWVPPFADPEVYENPVILEFLRRYWGRDDFYIKCFHSNNPYPGSEFQPWHRAVELAKEIPHVGLDTCPSIGVKFPLVDTSEENGSIEVLPSSQYLANPDLEGRYDEVLTQGNFPSTQRLNIEKGTMWIQDPRIVHRGTPNTSDSPRPEIVVCYTLWWMSIGGPIKVPPETYDGLSDRARELFQFCSVIDYCFPAMSVITKHV